MSAHSNYERYEEAKCDLGLMDVVNAFDYIQSLMKFVPKNDALREDYEYVIEPLSKFVSECLTKAKCPHCGRLLFYSDVEGYDYVCAECDENFYECEVK